MKFIKILSVAIIAFILSGCAATGGPDSNRTSGTGTCAKEALTALFEDPNMEKQINRVATATAILKVNNVMLYNMPVSVDAKWIDAVANDATPEQEQRVLQKLANEPYFATLQYTNVGNNALLSAMSKLTPVEKYLYNTLDTLYDTFPDIYTLSINIDELTKFSGGKQRPIEALRGDKYLNLEAAILSLVTPNDKKLLEPAIRDYRKSIDDVAKLKKEKGELEKDSALKSQNEQKIKLLEVQIKDNEAVSDEKEKIMDSAWKQAVTNLDTNIDSKKMQLVRKIQLILESVDTGDVMATCTYVTAGIKSYTALNQLQQEVQRLMAVSGMAAASGKGALMQQRIERLGKNALMAIPNIFVGTYLVAKQQIFASKYNDVISKLVSADDARAKAMEEKNKAIAEAAKKQDATKKDN